VLRDGAWRRRVEELLLARLRAPASQQFTLRHLCRELAVSRQTLSRRLRTEGTTFAEVQELVHRRVADALLRDDALPVAVVSDRLGYSEPAAFSRAYKRWTGRRPSEVMRQQ
jgi:AraC-like DNA-binding protein